MATKKTNDVTVNSGDGDKNLEKIGTADNESDRLVAQDDGPGPFEVPLKELNFGKAGVSDLFAKINEIIKYLNTLKQKPKVQ